MTYLASYGFTTETLLNDGLIDLTYQVEITHEDDSEHSKNLEIETKLYGYHHTLSSYEFTAWHSLELEWESKFKPDYVISLGSISNKLIICS